MNTPKLSITALTRLLWALVLVSLPVTSFRFMPFMGSGTYVRPLALYPLVILLPLLLVRIKRGEIARPWPGALTVLLAFVLVALAASAYGASLAPLEMRGVDFFDRALRAMLTLLIGLSFFIAAAWMNQDEADLRFSVKCLLIGLAADLIWGAIQYAGLNSGYRKELLQIQNLFSVRGLVKNKRISGFAYEPSWLAGQLTTLYLPWLAAALLARYRAWLPQTADHSATPTGLIRAWIEPLLLLGGLVVLFMTYSRSGLLVAVLAATCTYALTGAPTTAAFWAWLRAGFNRQRATRGGALWAASSRLLLALLVLAVLASAGAFLADKGYIATFFKSEKTDLFAYAVDVYLGPRLAYSSAALTAFEAHPFSGVGLGASGFWIYANMPNWVLSGVPEISRQMSPNSNLYPNPKNLYVRLLAETGLPGLLLFLAFYLAMFAEVLSLPRELPAGRWLAAAGIFSLSAIFLQGISQDSFAMPEMWINLGLLAGAAPAFQAYINQKTRNKR